MNKFRSAIINLYNYFLPNRHTIFNLIPLGVLLFSLIIGAGYRAIDIKENFEINGGFSWHVNLASHFRDNPGGYNFEDTRTMDSSPDEYVFSHHPKETATGSFENEKGWAFILSLIFPEGTKGMNNLAMIVMRYQFMLDLLVIVLLFFAGRAILGPLGASFSAILYALFKPAIRHMSFVSYYYWAIPFSALSIFFWTVIYKPEKKKHSLWFLSFLFFLYGILMGFATSVRLNFLFLPLFLSPLIFIRERNFKRSLTLLIAMLIGQSILLLPQVLITHKYYGKYSLSVRGKWHHVISGLGSYPNPFGIKDSGDLTAVNWAISRGGPELNKVGIQEFDKFIKKEAILIIKERPDIFIQNFRTNLYDGITMTRLRGVRYRGGPAFLDFLGNDEKYNLSYDPKILKLAHSFPWLVFFTALILFFFKRKSFWPLITVVFQGLYVLAILCMYFPPTDVHITAYFPIFALLLAIALATFIKFIIGVFEGGVRCWVDKRGIKYLPIMVGECFCQNWLKEQFSTQTKEPGPTLQTDKKHKRIKWIIIFLVILLSAKILFMLCLKRDVIYSKIDNATIQTINNILVPETNGGFESWSNRSPYGGFESWSNKEIYLPEEYFFRQSEKGKIKKATAIEEVKIGAASVKLEAGRYGYSQIYFNMPKDKLYYLRGKNIIIEAWVNSDSKEKDKVYISIFSVNAKDSTYFSKFYTNSGEWEKLSMSYSVPSDIEMLSIFCGVDEGASAYFDGVSVKYDDKK